MDTIKPSVRFANHYLNTNRFNPCVSQLQFFDVVVSNQREIPSRKIQKQEKDLTLTRKNSFMPRHAI